MTERKEDTKTNLFSETTENTEWTIRRKSWQRKLGRLLKTDIFSRREKSKTSHRIEKNRNAHSNQLHSFLPHHRESYE